MTSGTEFSEEIKQPELSKDVAQELKEVNDAALRPTEKIEIEMEHKDAEDLEKAFIESVPLAQAPERTPADKAAEGTVAPPETLTATQEDLDQGRSAENQNEGDLLATAEVQSVAAEVNIAAPVVTLEGAGEAGRVTIERTAEEVGRPETEDLDPMGENLPDLSPEGDAFVSGFSPGQQDELDGVVGLNNGLSDSGNAGMDGIDSVSGGAWDETVMIDTVPLPETPLTTTDTTSRESIGTWPTPEVPAAAVTGAQDLTGLETEEDYDQPMDPRWADPAVLSEERSTADNVQEARPEPAVITDSGYIPGSVNAAETTDSAAIIDSDDKPIAVAKIEVASDEIPETEGSTTTSDSSSETDDSESSQPVKEETSEEPRDREKLKTLEDIASETDKDIEEKAREDTQENTGEREESKTLEEIAADLVKEAQEKAAIAEDLQDQAERAELALEGAEVGLSVAHKEYSEALDEYKNHCMNRVFHPNREYQEWCDKKLELTQELMDAKRNYDWVAPRVYSAAKAKAEDLAAQAAAAAVEAEEAEEAARDAVAKAARYN